MIFFSGEPSRHSGVGTGAQVSVPWCITSRSFGNE